MRVPGPVVGARAAGALVALAGLVVAPLPSLAQQTAPLTKSELIRLLADDTYSAPEVVAIVGRSCLTFEPSPRDREDLRRLGAGDDLLRAIDACERRPLTATLEPARLTAPAGGTVRVTATVSRGGRPAGATRLILSGSERIAGSGRGRLSATTDERGRAAFEVPAGTAAGTYRLSLVAVGAELASSPVLRLDVTPAAPASARLSPARLEILAGETGAVRVGVRVTDRFGNPAHGRRLALRSAADQGAPAVATAVSDAGGEAELVLDADALRRGGDLLLDAGGRVLGELQVEVREAAATGPDAPTEAGTETDARTEAGEAAVPPAGGERAADPETREPDREAADASLRLEAEVLIGQGYRELSAGRPAPAADHFRAALELDPENVRALEGLARASATIGDPDEAVELYERVLAADSSNLEIRWGLARALERAERRTEAERTYRGILAADPGRTEVARELALLESRPHRFELSAWGGARLQEGSDPTLRAAEASLFVGRFVQVWGRYDRSLGLAHPPLLRGPDEVEGWFGGLGVLWGPDRRLATRLEVGRRTDEAAELEESLHENVVRLEQDVRVPAGRSFVGLTLGGYLGRWFDRDDWMVYGRGQVPLGTTWSVEPALFVGETIGTNTATTGRSAEREVRFLFPIAYRHPNGWSVEPGAALGVVEGETDATTGRLVEARLLLAAPVAGPHRLRVFLLHHSAPGTDPFRLATAGLWIRVP